MTGEEIGTATPWEIQRRIEGYGARMKAKRMFTASYITAPVINAGYRSPKRPVTPEKILPDDFRTPEAQDERDEWLAIAKAEEERREKLKHEQQHD
ncbi:hypothetical protein [Acidaminococcus timonensis]|uniref:hypothetical protein n=1 Tax=Acidaminococcus timonensis TaxID=1871002 RepID=UPI000AD78595|nr:hypothetical protein [Acidaminococcus timonensis]